MSSLRICMQNIRKWGSNPRVKMCLVLAVLFVYTYTSGLRMLAGNLNIDMNPWIFPFLFTHQYKKVTFMLPLLFIFCDAPFIDGNQTYVILRANRKSWSIGQLLYIMMGSFLYALLLLVSTFVCNIGYIKWGTTWGTVLGTAGPGGGLSAMKQSMSTVYVSNIIVRYYTPLQAMFFAFLLMWMSFILIGLVVYVMNVLTRTQMTGTLIAGFFILMTVVADIRNQLTILSPISWNSLNKIDVANTTSFPSIEFVLLVYIIIISVLVCMAVFLGKRQEIIVKEED